MTFKDVWISLKIFVIQIFFFFLIINLWINHLFPKINVFPATAFSKLLSCLNCSMDWFSSFWEKVEHTYIHTYTLHFLWATSFFKNQALVEKPWQLANNLFYKPGLFRKSMTAWQHHGMTTKKFSETFNPSTWKCTSPNFYKIFFSQFARPSFISNRRVKMGQLCPKFRELRR